MNSSIVLSDEVKPPPSGLRIAPLEAISDGIEKFNSGDAKIFDTGINKNIARPVSNYLLKRMGTPGFLISKYMNYRKQLTQPRCSISEKMSFASYILLLLGDIGDHVITIKNKKALEKDFSEKKALIDQQLASKEFMNDVRNQKITPDKNKSESTTDIQILTLDFMIEMEEKDLRRRELVATFKYPALALQLATNIINITELVAETSSLGIYAAKINACKTAGTPKKTLDELKIQAAQEKAAAQEKIIKRTARLENMNKDTPWYLKPFMWLAMKINGQSENIGKLNDFRKGVNGTAKSQVEYAEAANAQKAGSADLNAVNPAQSASYAEEMIVGIITQNKKESDEKGIKGKIVDDASDMAIRFAVRKLVKANIAAIDGFLRSATGRVLVYSYNLWVIYTDFHDTKEAIDVTKARISALKSYKEKFIKETSTVFSPRHLRQIKDNTVQVISWLQDVLIQKAVANNNKNSINQGEVKLCISDSNCKVKFDLLRDPIVQETFNSLPTQVQQSQLAVIKNSYSANRFVAFSRGEISLQQFDLQEIQQEIAQKEIQINKQFIELEKRKIININALLNYERSVIESDMNVYQQFMRPDFNLNPMTKDRRIDFVDLVPEKNQLQSATSAPVFQADSALTAKTIPETQIPNYNFNSSMDVHHEEKDLFEIIHKSYLKHYHQLLIPDDKL